MAAVSSWTHPKNVPVRPSWTDLHCTRPPPTATAETRCLESHERATGRLPGPPGQPAVTIFRIEGLVCCTALVRSTFTLKRPSPRRPTRRGDLNQVISSRADADLHASKVFLPINSFTFFLCVHQAPETLVPLLRLPTSNKTILPAKQAACDLCGLHGSGMRRLPLENWSAILF